jgi:hypothetical protein
MASALAGARGDAVMKRLAFERDGLARHRLSPVMVMALTTVADAWLAGLSFLLGAVPSCG